MRPNIAKAFIARDGSLSRNPSRLWQIFAGSALRPWDLRVGRGFEAVASITGESTCQEGGLECE